jgi:hypothetical protein
MACTWPTIGGPAVRISFAGVRTTAKSRHREVPAACAPPLGDSGVTRSCRDQHMPIVRFPASTMGRVSGSTVAQRSQVELPTDLIMLALFVAASRWSPQKRVVHVPRPPLP